MTRAEQLAKYPILKLARKRLAETEHIEYTPEKFAEIFIARGAGSMNYALAHLSEAMVNINEWDSVVKEIKWSIEQAEAHEHEGTADD